MAVSTDYIIRLKDRFSAQLKGAQVQADKLNGKVSKINGGFSGLGSTLARIGAVTAVGFAAKEVATLGINMEQTRVAFATFLGDGEKANKLIAQLNEFANVTPFNNAEIIKSGRLLLAAGIPAEKVTDQLKQIGDVAAGANVPITELAAIFQKATNKGKLQAEELNQFAERGIPILDQLSKQFGVSKEEVLKLGSEGKITSQVMNEAFKSMTSEGGIFFNLMEKQSQTVGGRISTLIGKLQTLGIKIGEALLPAIGALTDLAIKLIENTDILKTIALVIGIAAGAFITYNTIIGISTLLNGGFTASMAALNAVILANPIGLAVAGLALLVSAFVVAWRHSERFKGVLMGVWELIKQFGRDIGKIFGSIGNLFVGLFTFDKELIKSSLSELATSLNEFGKDSGKAYAQGFAKGAPGLAPSERNEFDAPQKNKSLTSKGGTTPGLTSTTGTGSLKAGISEVKAGAPKTFNINIEKLVEGLNINTTNLTDSASKIQEEVQKALLLAVTDTSIISE